MTSPRKISSFQQALNSVESLSVGDQVVLVDVLTKRMAAHRRRQLAREIAQGRRDYRRSKIRRGTAADLMTELRA